MNKFINDAVIISGKTGKYPFIIANTDSSGKGGTPGGAYLILNQKLIFFSLTLLVSMV